MLVKFPSNGWLAKVDLSVDVNELVVNGRFGGGIWHLFLFFLLMKRINSQEEVAQRPDISILCAKIQAANEKSCV